MNRNLSLNITGFLMVAVSFIFSACTLAGKSSIEGENAIKNSDTTHLEFTVEEDSGWTSLFLRKSGWFGGDGIFSIPLKENRSGQTSDSTMFLFSDSMFGEIVDDSLQPGFLMTHNSVAYLRGSNPDSANIRFYSDEDTKGKPETIFIPNTPNSVKGDYYWLGDGFVNRSLDDNIYIFAYRMRNTSSDDWSFKQMGNTLIVLKAGSKPPFTDQRQIETPFLIEGAGKDNGSFGAGIFVNTKDAGVADPDGYIYVYGVRGQRKNLFVSRVLPGDFENFEKWTFWNGNAWVGNINGASNITDRVSNELSVSPLPDGRYALVFQVDGMDDAVGLRLGLTPYGPFGPIIKLWDCKESEHKNYFSYNAKAHPCLSNLGELLISYNVNAFNFISEIKQNPNLYRPRFIKLKLLK